MTASNGHLWRLVVAGALAAMAEVASIALVATAVWLVVTAGQRPGLAALSLAIVAVRALALSAGVLRYLQRLASHDAVLAFLAEARARLVADLIPRSATLTWSRWVQRLVTDVDSCADLLLRGALPVAAVATTGLLGVAVTAVVCPPAAIALGVGLAAVTATGVVAVRAAARAGERTAALGEMLTAATVELARAGRDLAVFGGLDAAHQRAAALSAQICDADRRTARDQGLLRAGAGLLAGAAVLTVLAATAQLAQAPAAVAPVVAAALLTDATALVIAAPRLAEALGARRRLTRAASSAPPITEPARPRPLPDGSTPHLRLEEPDLDLPPGTRLLLTGASGCGKTTVLQHLWKITPPSARYTIDGIDVAEVQGDALRQRVGGLWQDAYLPRASLRDSLRLARPHASDTELEHALATVGLPADVRPGGLDAVIAEGGENLSGGQRRRLLVARTLLADHRVMLFDEPTEGLPPAAADTLTTTLLQLPPSTRTVIVVTHRLPTPLPAGVLLHHLTALPHRANSQRSTPLSTYS